MKQALYELQRGNSWEPQLGSLLGANVRSVDAAPSTYLPVTLFPLPKHVLAHYSSLSSCCTFSREWRDLLLQVVIPHTADAEFDTDIEEFSLGLLSHSEVRVRNAVAQTLGVLASKHGAQVWERCRDTVLQNITANYVRNITPGSVPQSRLV